MSDGWRETMLFEERTRRGRASAGLRDELAAVLGGILVAAFLMIALTVVWSLLDLVIDGRIVGYGEVRAIVTFALGAGVGVWLALAGR